MIELFKTTPSIVGLGWVGGGNHGMILFHGLLKVGFIPEMSVNKTGITNFSTKGEMFQSAV